MAPATTRERVGLFVGLNLGSSFSWRTWRRLGRLAVQLGTRNSKLETRTLEIKLMPKILSCPKCSFETTESLARCPSCGSRLQSARKVRILGWLLLVIGTGLVLFMGALGLYLASIIAQSGEPGGTTRFTGGPQDVALIVAVFGLVISFGLASMAGGLWQIIYGKPNRKVMVAMFLVAGILVAIAWVIRQMD